MEMIYKAKFRMNGVTYYINTKNKAKRDAAVDIHRDAGIAVEVYEAPARVQPPADVPGDDVSARAAAGGELAEAGTIAPVEGAPAGSPF